MNGKDDEDDDDAEIGHSLGVLHAEEIYFSQYCNPSIECRGLHINKIQSTLTVYYCYHCVERIVYFMLACRQSSVFNSHFHTKGLLPFFTFTFYHFLNLGETQIGC